MKHCIARFLLVVMILPVAVFGDLPTVEVYKSPTCGCCVKWVNHLKSHGFTVKSFNVQNVGPIKQQNKLPRHLASCHTAFVDGYIIEGHVPATDILRLLKERPDVSGLAVPGMPIGSPGMEGPNPETYEVLSFDRSGKTQTFATHRP